MPRRVGMTKQFTRTRNQRRRRGQEKQSRRDKRANLSEKSR